MVHFISKMKTKSKIVYVMCLCAVSVRSCLFRLLYVRGTWDGGGVHICCVSSATANDGNGSGTAMAACLCKRFLLRFSEMLLHIYATG